MMRMGMVTLALAGALVAPSPSTYQLALGDSLPYGFTTAKARAGLPPAAFVGFTDVLGAGLRLRTTNLSCPGETTTTFAVGPCPWTAAGFALHSAYAGPQLAAAERFLRDHRGRTSLVTLTVWGNDVNEFLASCPDLACVVERAPAEIAAFAARLDALLRPLRAADPSARIVVVGAMHVQLDEIEAGDRLIASFNAAMSGVAARHGARFADPTPWFNPRGPVAVRRVAVCALTLVCGAGDTHPSPAGHLVLAGLIARTI